MKLLFSTLLFVSLSASAQFSIESSFNRNATANNQTLMVNYTLNNWTFGLGGKYLFNKRLNYPRSVLFKRTFWGQSLGEHLGIQASAMYKIWDLERANFKVFYDLQVTRSSNRFDLFFKDITNDVYLRSFYISPVWGIENNIGLQFQFDLTDHLYFSQKAGVGILLYQNNSDDPFISFSESGWVFSEMFSIGLGWKFDSSK